MVVEAATAGSGSPVAGGGNMSLHSYRLGRRWTTSSPTPTCSTSCTTSAARELKEPMFPWLDLYFPVSGRLRRRQAAADGEEATGRPYLRCNDCGVRIVEVACDATVEEWLEAEAERGGLSKALAYDKVIGPELFFSPLL